MASFTDQITQFRPYVQQLPLEAMAQVGMYKQQKYEEGVQKIQGYINDIAGLPIVKDIDKQYLQSKLNTLGNNLKKVAAGDFSNFQLVNSVGGMATQIVKDPNVQNAVSATARYMKELEFMESERKAGKSAPENMWLFNQEASNWLNSKVVGESFNARYSPYVDVKKKILTDVIGKLNPNLREEDIPWEMDKFGNVNVGKIAAAMTRLGTEGITADKLKNAINASLSPTELNQLSISGRYQFKDVTPDQLANYVTLNASRRESDIDATITQLEGYANLNKSNTEIYNKTLDSINYYKRLKENLPNQTAKEIEELQRNPEAAKAEIYKNGFLNSFAEAFSWEKQKKNLVENPVLNAQHWEKDYALRRSAESRQWEALNWQKQMDVADLDIKKQTLDLQLAKVFGAPSGITTYLGESTAVKNPLAAINMDLNAKETEYTGFIGQLARQLKTTPAAAEQQLMSYRNGNKESIPVEWRGRADMAIDNKIKADNLKTLLKRADDEVRSSPDFAKSKDKIDSELSKLPPINLKMPDGRMVTFTSNEIFNFLNKEKTVSIAEPTPLGTATRIKKEIDPNQLSEKERILYNSYQGASKNPQISNFIKGTLNRYESTVRTFKDDQDKYNKALSDNLMTKTGKYIPSETAYIVSDKEGAVSRDRFETLAMTALSKFTGVAGGIPGGAAELSSSQAKEARDWLAGKDKGNIFFSKLVQGDKTFLLMKKGSAEIAIPLTAFEEASLPRGKNDLSMQEMDIKETQSYFNGNTSGVNDPTRAYFQRPAFSNIRTLSVTADLNADKTPGKSGLNYLNLNLKLPSGWKNLQLDDYPMDVKNSLRMVSSLTDEDVKKLFLNNRNVPEAWKEEIRQLQ